MAQWLTSERYGTGADGALTISADTTESPTDASCSGSSGSTSLSATNASFSANQIILIHQTRGTGAGNWELNAISSYTGGTITTKYPLAYTYTDSGASQAQVRVLPQYSSVTINSGKTYTAKAWDGNIGGILAFLCNGTVTVTGTISASSQGFLNNSGGCGEGTAGAEANKETANGNGGAGAYGDWFIGGGGGHAAAGDTSSHPTFPANQLPGGEAVGTASLSSMNFGGAGGVGTVNGAGGGGGGKGGGIILIIGKTITVTGSVVSTGGAGNTSTAQAAGGGGGAGGSILIKGQNITLGSNLVVANFGTGANSTKGSVGRIAASYSSTITGSTTPTITTAQDSSLGDIGGAILFSGI